MNTLFDLPAAGLIIFADTGAMGSRHIGFKMFGHSRLNVRGNEVRFLDLLASRRGNIPISGCSRLAGLSTFRNGLGRLESYTIIGLLFAFTAPF
jgi:hypothetical protein